MEFDKSEKGYWNATDSTYLDDVAYNLFYTTQINNGYKYVNQLFFRHHRKGYPYSKYYQEAKILIRNEKISKIQKPKNR